MPDDSNSGNNSGDDSIPNLAQLVQDKLTELVSASPEKYDPQLIEKINAALKKVLEGNEIPETMLKQIFSKIKVGE